MIFSVLGRYFFTRYLITVGWFFFGVISIIYLIDFSEVIGNISVEAGQGTTDAMLITALRLPYILQQTVPFIALFSAMVALIALNRRNELVVTRSAGISVWQFIMPFVIGAALLGAASVVALNPLASWTQKKALGLEAIGHGQDQTVPWLRQLTDGQDTIIGGRGIAESGTELLQAVVIYFDDQGALFKRQDAERAVLSNGWWTLYDVTETEVGELSTHRDEVRVKTNLDEQFVQQNLVQPDLVSIFALPRQIDLARQFGISSKALETQYNYLLSLPFLLVAMTLIAATVCLKFSRFAQSPAVILGGILSGFLLYVTSVLVKAFGSSGVLSPLLAAWIPVVVAMALGLTILLHQEDG
ncbi:LPS export ABC transporter permease LptG [Martelella lutilitoris]|mgnify:CR=1 FL=1|uniref:LPS export ABC transporter permease LptG n=1 Tax=Martelella lutilitoris TaxID=2583532 RepID=A0A7T7HNG3_9HYPH|nr:MULTISPECIES: LPS export ABC transporter permease LptG [Martelella]AMM84703.1 LPS export ABC transporter permease LptG [Martelella sp. AD-3]MAM09917.1 LPS export ABC transporter permease LptG [Rhizobiaceae bacterium]QQM32278.1 LPS export ABC transporter permease LptG [Martelella lutilitoris]